MSQPWELRAGDCLDPVTGLASLPDGSVSHVICDPPYSAHVHGNARTNKAAPHARALKIDFEHLSDETRQDVAREFARLVRRWILIFCEVEGSHLWRQALLDAGVEYVRTGYWIRVDSMPQVSGDRPAAGAEIIMIAHGPEKKRWHGGGKRGVWTTNVCRGPERAHPTQKPLALMEALVRDFTDPGDLIADPFSGSGTTLLAAVRLGRRAIGWERDPQHHETARRRLSGEEVRLTAGQMGLFGTPEGAR